jgi:hypothetical protein
MKINQCRFCEKPLKYTFARLGMSPLSNSYLTEEKLLQMEQGTYLAIMLISPPFQKPGLNTPAIMLSR